MPSRKGLLLATAAAIIAGASLAASPPAAAQGQHYSEMSCQALWVARNQIFADAGYCFQTDRAIRVFGPGCFPPYGRLTPQQQDEVNEIQYWERRLGCR